MEIVKIAAIGAVAAIMALYLRQSRAEMAVVITLAAGTVILLMLMGTLETLIADIRTLAARFAVEDELIRVCLRTVAIAAVADMGAHIARDAGESAVAAKVELGGKVLIAAAALPVLGRVLDVILAILP